MKILFVCTGNTCRSPMAAALFEALAGKDFFADSAGLSAMEGAPATESAVSVMAEKGINIEGHLAKRVSIELIKDFDLFVTMSPSHALALSKIFGIPKEKIKVLGGGISDPYGLSTEYYRDTAKNIESALQQLIKDLRDNGN